MSEIVYRLRDDELEHATKYSVGHYDTSKYKGAINTKKRYGVDTKNIIGRKSAFVRQYGSYKSPYYDPVARHERYLKERSSMGIQGTYGTQGPSGRKGSGSGKGKGGSGKGKSKGGSGKGKGGNANMSATIQKLREESSLNSDAQREATRRKIEDLQNQLRQQIEKFRKAGDEENPLNVSEIRGNIQTIKEQIKSAGGDLQKWISHEKDALERRIAAVYRANGKKYTPRLQADNERASKKRNKEVNSRADAIYKSKSKKK